jgi:3-isopropylmalate/(R)-2-methylmalate dehydratase large subunit
MGFTIAEKILGTHAAGSPLKAGYVVVAKVDFAMIHDAKAPGALAAVERLNPEKMPFAGQTALVMDHYSPPPTDFAANTHVALRAFAQKYGTVLYEVGSGICHQLLPENGHLTCGDLIAGTDTHSTTYGAFNAFGAGVEGSDVAGVMASGRCWFKIPETIKVVLTGQLSPGVWAKDVTLHMLGRFGAEGCNYKVLEYKGSAVAMMDMDDRMTLCNHAAELGAKAAILEADDKTADWLKQHGARDPRPVVADADAEYIEEVVIDASILTPQVARGHMIDDIVPVESLKEYPVHVALIGSCTNGRLSDIRQAAAIVRGRKISRGVRFLVTPASRSIYEIAEREGLLRDITAAGGLIEPPGCGPCVSITQKIVPGNGEVVISSANRNFKGRLGNPDAEILIASAATVAASALTGRATDPRAVEGGTWRQA